MHAPRFRPTNQRGMILLVFLITIPFLILIATYYLRESLTSFQVARQDQLRTEAQLAADAGADYGVEQVSQDNTWTGTGGEVTLHTDSSIKTTYSVAVTTNSTSSKTMTVTGRTYWPANTTTARKSVTIYVDLRPVSSGTYSIVSGEGGLYMSNSSKIVGGDVFINGTVSLSNTAQIGLSTNPVNVSVADQVCGLSDGTYPRVCTAADNPAQPITINNSAHIYGVVQATNQTSGNGMSNTGLQASSSVAPKALPTYDRAAQKAAVANTINSSVNCSSGSLSWPANTKIEGNVNISNKCKVTVNGNVWVTGNFSLSNSSQLIVADSLDTTVPVIMVDGSGGAIFSNSSQVVSNTNSTGPEFITYYCGSGCDEDGTVTGSTLANSRTLTTISLNNNSSAPNTIFYAYWSEVSIGNSGQIGALIGQTVSLNNSGTITFGTSITTGGSTTWVVNGYRRY